MIHPISWDPSLVKKFSSSNHFKLLNQLRNEVKKYPLKNKKNSTSIQSKNINQEKNNKLNTEHPQKGSLANNSNKSSDLTNNKSNVSFNNSKNFSIYNQTTDNNIINQQNEKNIPAQSKSNQDSSFPSFKDRLNQIDMK